MPLNAADMLESFKQHGLRFTVISVVSTICLGIADQFTGKIIPSAALRIENFFDPPRFFINFDAPVDISAGLTVSALSVDAATPVAYNKVGERVVAARAGPGFYQLQLRGGRDRAAQELVATKVIEKTNEIWQIDTSERNWANAAALRSGGASAPAPSSGASLLTATRWSTTEPDFAVLATVQDPILRSMLANALAEVGVLADGTDREKRRILSYWAGITDVTPGRLPWSGAFIGWVTKQAGAEPPKGAASGGKRVSGR